MGMRLSLEVAVDLLATSDSGEEVDTILARAGIAEPTPVPCPSCDYSAGMRDMGVCGACEGTGSVFLLTNERGELTRFPNTEQGYVGAARAATKAMLFEKEKYRG